MRIGILTFYNSANFGANLQGISTYLYLKKQGHCPIFINYKSEENYRNWLRLHTNDQFKVHLDFVNSIITEQTRFCHSTSEIRQIIREYSIEALIIGSDAVLQHHPMLTCFRFGSKHIIRRLKYVPELNFPSPFWGVGISDYCPTAIMSASSQNSPYKYFPNKIKRKMYDSLSPMRYISVRDNWTKNMVTSILDCEVPVTPDPVFAFNYNAPELIGTHNYIVSKYNIPTKYVLICLSEQTLPIKELDILKELYTEIGISCVALRLPDGIKFRHNFDYEISSTLPSNEWYSLIKHSCGYIGTNMHPIVVSLHNAVPCYSIDNWGRTDFFNRKIDDDSSKVKDILNIFGVSSNHTFAQRGTCNVTAQHIFQKMQTFPIELVKLHAKNYEKLYLEMMETIVNKLRGG